jgi:hypothetical protein
LSRIPLMRIGIARTIGNMNRRPSALHTLLHTEQTLAQDSGLWTAGWQLLIAAKGDYESTTRQGADRRDHFCVDYGPR